MMKLINFDVHVCTPDAGHLMSEDCWCEPTKAYWLPGKDGRLLHVLEHNDTHESWPVWLEDRLRRIE